MASERNQLPGSPSNRLIREVRRTLRVYVHCRPERDSRLWRLTWEWAASVACRGFSVFDTKRRWPAATEIASQFLLLALAEMRDDRMLRLPYRAAESMPPAVKAVLGQGRMAVPLLESKA